MGCHGEKGIRAFVEVGKYDESVHGKLPCDACHRGIDGYPHQRAEEVRCMDCHLSGGFGAQRGQAEAYMMSVHGGLPEQSAPGCKDCHGYHYVFPSNDVRSQTYKPKVPGLCARCHEGVYEIYAKSIHGTELLIEYNIDAADCFDCHMEHRTPQVGAVGWKLWLIKECGSCHSRQLDTYRDTYHGQVTELGYVTVAKCSDCHGSHNITRVLSTGSALSTDNRLDVCRKCHPQAPAGFKSYYVHPDEHDSQRYPKLYYSYMFMSVLLAGVFVFFFTHTFLWLFRSIKERHEGKARDE